MQCPTFWQPRKSGWYNSTDMAHTAPEFRWPSEGFHCLTVKKKVTYDDLTLPQSVTGQLTNIYHMNDQTTARQALLQVILAMKDATSLPWTAVKNAWATSMHDLEEGHLSWDNSTQWAINRLSASQISMANSQVTHPTQPKRICKFFNEGVCSHDSNHSGYRHCCSFCDVGITSNEHSVNKRGFLQKCKCSVSHVHNTQICQYKEQLMNIINTEQEVNVVYSNINSSEMLYDNVSSLSVRETGVNGDHYSTHHDSGHMGPSWTQNTHNTFHVNRANGLQSTTPDGLQFFTYHRFNYHPKALESVRPGHHCHNQRGSAPMHYPDNQLICCAVCFTNKYWQNTDQSVDTNWCLFRIRKKYKVFIIGIYTKSVIQLPLLDAVMLR